MEHRKAQELGSEQQIDTEEIGCHFQVSDKIHMYYISQAYSNSQEAFKRYHMFEFVLKIGFKGILLKYHDDDPKVKRKKQSVQVTQTFCSIGN